MTAGINQSNFIRVLLMFVPQCMHIYGAANLAPFIMCNLLKCFDIAEIHNYVFYIALIPICIVHFNCYIHHCYYHNADRI